MDQITLTGMDFYGYHGCLPEEREKGQHFFIDLTIYAELQKAGEMDDLSATINYASVYETVRAVVEGEPVRLIETVAERIAAAILREELGVQRLDVTVHKPSAPLGGPFRDAAVHIARSRS